MAATQDERVQVRHVVTGRYLASGATWTHAREAGLVLDDATAARQLVVRLGCEPGAFDVVAAAPAASCQAA